MTAISTLSPTRFRFADARAADGAAPSSSDRSEEDSTDATELLLPRVAANEPGAVDACIDQYGRLVMMMARRMFGSDVNDAVQEVFISLWKNAHRFDPSAGSELTFVATLTRRRLIDRLRQKQRRIRRVEVGLPDAAASATVDTADVRATLGDEAQQALDAFDELRPEQQQVLRLAIQHGLTHEQISRHLEMPIGTVKSHARRGLIRVREMLARSEQPLDDEVVARKDDES